MNLCFYPVLLVNLPLDQFLVIGLWTDLGINTTENHVVLYAYKAINDR